jgi:hypothetical protein
MMIDEALCIQHAIYKLKNRLHLTMALTDAEAWIYGDICVYVHFILMTLINEGKHLVGTHF